MYEIVVVFDTQFTNSCKYWKTNQKNTQTGVFDFWQGHLCDSRADFIHELLRFGKEVNVFLKHL